MTETRPSWPRAILFDLDGTLIDSAPDIHESLNQTMESLGHPPFTLEAVIGMIGRGVPTLIERAHEALLIELDAATRDRIVDRFLKIYNPRATELTTLNAGASDTVRHFREIDLPIGVVTNKPEAETREILRHFGVLDLMVVVVGGDAGPAKKPAPDLLFLACERLSIAPGEALFVGDSENDVEAAKAAGMKVVAVRGGYTKFSPDALGADLVIDRLDALAGVLASLAPDGGA